MEKGEQPRALQLHGIKIPLTPGKDIRGYGIPGTLFYCRGSFARRRRKVSSFTSSMTTAVRGIKKIMPMMPKSFPPIMAAIRCIAAKAPRISHHTGINELVFNKLHGKVHDQAAHRQHRVYQQHKEHTDHAGDQCTHIGMMAQMAVSTPTRLRRGS